MRSNLYKLLTLLFLCFYMNGFGQNCINDFGSGNYTVMESVSTLDSSIYDPCGTYIAPGTNITTGNGASIVSSTNESFLDNISGNAIKLNPTNHNGFERTTIRTNSFTITDNILSFEFLQVGTTHINHNNPYFQYRLLNAVTLEEIDSGCYEVYHEDAVDFGGMSLYNDCLYNSTPIDSEHSTVFTPHWVTQEFDVSTIISTQVILEFTASDCNFIDPEGQNHYSTVYIDNICQTEELANSGNITMNSFTRLNCPTENFTVSGTYETPTCDTDPVSITAYMAPFVPGNPNGTANATEIASGTFDDFNYSFNIDPSTFTFIPFQDYNIFVIITFADGSTDIAHLKYWELTFDNCENINSCEGTSLTITNANEFPSCDALNYGSPWFFIVDVTITVPEGYDMNNLQDDYNDNAITLDIIDTENNDDILATLNNNSWQDISLANGILQFSFPINGVEMLGAYNGENYVGNFEFQVIAHLTTDDGSTCSINDTVFGISFDDCQNECPDCKEDIMENISIVQTTNCNTFEFNIPESSDCYEVIYALNNVDQGQLPEGTSPLTLNENGSYSIQIGVIDIETGKACAKRTFIIDVECSDEPCPDCNKDILENISIAQTDDCNTFEISVPELFDCYKVVYFIDGVHQDTLTEGSSTITFEDNGSYQISFAVIDLETDKTCAKKGLKIDVDCFGNTVCVENPALEDLLATHLKTILNAILVDFGNNYTGSCAAGSVSFVDITNMPEVIQFMQEYNLEERLQHAMDTKELETNGNYSGYTANITQVYYKWGSNNQGHPPCLSIWFTNESISENGSVFLYQISGGYLNGGVPISQIGLNPTLIQEFTNIEIDVEQFKATYDYIGIDGQSYSLYDALVPRTISENKHSGLSFCHFHDLNYNPPRMYINPIDLYPNPASDKVSVSVENSKIASVELYNIYGKPVLQVKNVDAFKMSIQTDRFARGYYVLKVTLEDGSVQHKNVILK